MPFPILILSSVISETILLQGELKMNEKILLVDDEKEIAVQINGKTKVTVNISVNDDKDTVIP